MDSKRILYILIVLVIVLYLSGFIYLMVSYLSNRKRKEDMYAQNMMILMSMINNNNNNNQNNNQTSLSQSSCNIDSPQTEFFKKSMEHAEKVLMGNVYLDGYRYGSGIDLTKLNDDTKRSIIISMQYMMIEPITSRNIEHEFRLISEQENVPLWFVILHRGIKKLIPIELSDESSKLNQQDNSNGAKIIPIYQVA